MFWHFYRYRLLTNLKQPQLVFWALIFPLLLAVVFQLTIGGIQTDKPIHGAFVENEAFSESSVYRDIITDVNAADTPLKLKQLSIEEARQALFKNELDGYFVADKGGKLELHVVRSGLEQNVLRSFGTAIEQRWAQIEDLLTANPGRAVQWLTAASQDELAANSTNGEDSETAERVSSNSVSVYFFSLFGMGALFGASFAIHEVEALEANKTPEGQRIRVAPLHHLRLIGSSFLVVLTLLLFCQLVQLAFIIWIQKLVIPLALVPWYLVITLAGTFASAAIGAVLGVFIRKPDLAFGINVGLSLTMSFLAGMMHDGIRYIINTRLPWLSLINPAEQMTDALYSLYYYEDLGRVGRNLLVLVAMGLVLGSIAVLKLRRQRYVHL
ncbi:MAG: ABC transporter permease [Bacillota bacterium]|nr:ABC transporter permease [Bacillota bacterium]